MGFYECVHDCGDNCYCVSIGSSLDNFESTSWIHCSKHKDINNQSLFYDLTNFTRKFSDKMTQIHVTAKKIDSKLNAKDIMLIKLELNMTTEEFAQLNLKDYRKLYFTEFDDEPSWQIIEEKIYIIERFDQLNVTSYVDSPQCHDPNILFNWHTNTVMTKEEYEKWESLRVKIN